MTAHIRHRIKVAGIKARVKIGPGIGKYIYVSAPSYEVIFTPDEIETINIIAQVNKLTKCQGYTIDPQFERQLIGKTDWAFYLPTD